MSAIKRKKKKFARMYAAHADNIYKWLYVHSQNEDLARELMASTFVRTWIGIETLDFKRATQWLYKEAANLLADQWRRRQMLPPVGLEISVGEDAHRSALHDIHEYEENHKIPPLDAKLKAEIAQRIGFQMPYFAAWVVLLTSAVIIAALLMAIIVLFLMRRDA